MLLFLLILLLPSQLSHHFWPSWSLINGIRSDYLSPTLYLTDIIILGLMIFSRTTFRKNTTSVLRATPSYLGGGKGVVLIVFITLNIFFSLSPLVSIYKWLRVYEYYWLFKYLVNNIQYSARLQRLVRSTCGQVFGIRLGLSLVIIWTSILAWWQFTLQHSVDGLWYWLGERTFSISTPGIARIILNGELFLRPYATLPHPNALAGFLLVGGLILYHLCTTSLPPPKLGGGGSNDGGGILICWSLLFAALTIPITFSRSAILIEIGIVILWLVRKYNKLLLILFIVPIVMYFYLPSSPNSIPERILLNQKAIETIKNFPVFGVGLGNSVSLLPSLRQPTHNIFLLLMVELGLPISIILFVLFFRNYLEFGPPAGGWNLRFAFLLVLLTGTVDHYWLTLHQNTLLLVVLLSLIKVQSMTKNDHE